MSYPNWLSNNLALSLINLTKSPNLGLRSDTKIFPAHSVHFARRNIGNFLVSSLKVFMWLRSATYSVPIPVKVRSAVSKCLLNSNKEGPSTFFRLGRCSSFLICASAITCGFPKFSRSVSEILAQCFLCYSITIRNW